MLRPNKTALAIILLSSLGFSSCELINPPEPIPAYIRIDTVKVRITDIDHGSSSHGINNIWVSVGGENLGVFELPFNVPTFSTGFQTLSLLPGVKLNGISASRYAYPFFEPYLFDIELQAGKIHLVEPATTYKNACKFVWMENFEDAGVAFSFPDYSNVRLTGQNEVVREGRYSGIIPLTKVNKFFEGISRDQWDMPPKSSPVILEFDYQNTNSFEVGMYIIEDGAAVWNSLMVIKPSSYWKRIYVDLGTILHYNNNAEEFKAGFRAEFEDPDSLPTNIYLDNLKLIHF